MVDQAQLVAQSAHAVIGIDDRWGEQSAQMIPAGQRSTVSVERDADYVWHEGAIHRGSDSGPLIVTVSGIDSLRGAHNGQNAAAAIAACAAVGCTAADMQAALRSFPGLAHRMEMVGRKGRVLFVNDSKATNADSTEKALGSFGGDIYWILGGKAKDGGISGLAPFFPRVARAYLIGASTDMFAAALDGVVPYVRSGTLDAAIAQAARDAAASTGREPVVLLSPACASYDQFPNFEVRGDYFRTLAQAIIPRDSERLWIDAMASRTERTPVADWWWTVDRYLLAALLTLMVCGIVFLMGGGRRWRSALGSRHFISCTGRLHG